MQKLLVYLLLFALVLGAVFTTAPQITAANIQRYGYTLLSNDIQRSAYNALKDGVEALQSKINLTVAGITKDNVNTVLEDVSFGCRMVARDYPEYFWFDGGANISGLDKTVTLTPNPYKVNGQIITSENELAPYKRQLNTAVNKAMAKINKNSSDYEIAHEFHDHLISTVTYAQEGDHQTAYGALVLGKAVCAGYTRAYQLLMNLAGISSYYISGTSYAPSGKIVSHAWNLVWLDGMCYYTDVTWDDQVGELFHEYLNLSKEEIGKTHSTNDKLPASCGHDGYTFFVRNDGKGVCDFHGHKNSQQIAQCFELRDQNSESATYYCTIHYHGDDFRNWFNQHKVAIIKALGLGGSVECRIIELGLEHHVTLTGKPISAEPQPTDPPALSTPTQPPAQTKPQTTEPPAQAPTFGQTQAPTEGATEGTAPAETVMQTQPETAPEQTESTETDTLGETEPTESAGDTNSESNGTTTIAIVVSSIAAAGCGGAYWYFLRRRRF